MEEIVDNRTVYKIKELSNKQKKSSKELNASGVHPIMAEIYTLRGIENFSDLNLIQKLEPYTNMKGTREAAKILAQAILRKEKICVIADYDVDGATACTVAVRGLRMFGANVDYVVPDRFLHGYGLTPSVIDEAIQKKNPDLLVTVDNGIASNEGIAYAKSKGLDVLVTDHHLAGEVIPPALCIVNPNQPGCEFTSKSIAGCGVMFYVLAALRQHMIDLEVYTTKNVPNVFSLLDLVAIGTICDVVKLDLNNRIIVKLGLDLIRKNQTRAGVLAIIKVAGGKFNELSTTDIGFKLGPRINAAGRLEDMSIGINCLLTDNHDTAEKLATQLNDINKNRRLLESDMKEVALELPSLQETKFAKVAYDESFHEGVIGIVASRIKEMFYRPTIVFAPAHEDDLIKGSGRSIPEIHLRDALDYVYKKNPEIIKKFGGHAMAAGLTIKKELLPEFCKLFEEAVEFFAQGRELVNAKEIDKDLEANHINIETAELIKNEIWGQGFPPPLFVGDFSIIEQRLLKNKQTGLDAHLKLKVEKGGKVFDGIWFFRDTMIETEEAKLVFTLDINEYMERRNVQLLIDGVF